MAELKPWLEQRIKDTTAYADLCRCLEEESFYRGKVVAFKQVLQFMEKQAIDAWNKRS